jgi:hypothetical protein
MKSSSTFTAFVLKAVPVIICTTTGFSSFIVVNAQLSVVGKWKEVSAKQFFTTEGAKQTGKSVIEKQTSVTDKVEFEFKSDHTYAEVAGHINFHTSNGTWSVSGDQLTMIGTPEKKAGMEGRVYTFLITDKTMTRTMMTKPPNNTMVYKQEDISIRM